MKTAVLLAAYNGMSFIEPLLSSLRGQTARGFTVLAQDDGSTDGTSERISAFAAEDTRFSAGSEQGKHLGAAGNFISLMRQTDADLALLCDQDDIWRPEKIETLQKAMLDAEHAYGSGCPLLVHSDSTVIDGNGQTVFESLFRHQGWDPAAVELRRLLVQNNVTGCTVMINRPLIDLVAEHADPRRVRFHDWFIAQTAAAFGHIVFVPQPLVMYRQHTDNAIGASAGTQFSRGVGSLSRAGKARQRIALTYDTATMLRAAYGALMPRGAAETVDAYLATRGMSKLARVLKVQRMGCTMQSAITRAGQLLYG